MVIKQSRINTKTEKISVAEIRIPKENERAMYLLIYWTLGTYRTNEKDRKCQHLVDITETHGQESGHLWHKTAINLGQVGSWGWMMCKIKLDLKANWINLHIICSVKNHDTSTLCRAEHMLGNYNIMATTSPKSRYNPSIKELKRKWTKSKSKMIIFSL